MQKEKELPTAWVSCARFLCAVSSFKNVHNVFVLFFFLSLIQIGFIPTFFFFDVFLKHWLPFRSFICLCFLHERRSFSRPHVCDFYDVFIKWTAVNDCGKNVLMNGWIDEWMNRNSLCAMQKRLNQFPRIVDGTLQSLMTVDDWLIDWLIDSVPTRKNVAISLCQDFNDEWWMMIILFSLISSPLCRFRRYYLFKRDFHTRLLSCFLFFEVKKRKLVVLWNV